MRVRRVLRAGVLAVCAALVVNGLVPVMAGAAQEQESALPEPARPRVASIRVDQPAVLDALAEAGFDVLHDERTVEGGGVAVSVAYHPRMEQTLRDLGAEIVGTRTAPTQEQLQREFVGRAATVTPDRAAPAGGGPLAGRTPPQLLPEDGSIRVLRADWFTNYSATFLSVEVAAAGPDAVVTVTPDTGAPFDLVAFVDRGVYLYHRVENPVPLDAPPTTITVTADDGSTVTTPAQEWVDEAGDGYPAGYRWGFTDDGYVDPLIARDRIQQLAAEFPDLAEIVDLPNDSPGYAKPAQALIGTDPASAFFVKTAALGHEGGNGGQLTVLAFGADQPLSVAVDGRSVRVFPATGPDGAILSTADEVVAAINASDAAAFLTAFPLGSGDGPVQEGSAPITDGLDAPPEYPRGPFDIQAIRIGAQRDGSKTGVFLYSQEHAREWVTPLVALEVAERLLRNYGTDPATTRMVDELDIFVLPVVNPDGSAYSLYDDLFKRKNLHDYCDPAVSSPLFDDSNYFVGWTGVDLNRNFSVGSRLDGFVGASANCASQVYSGPSELSEPEARNETWLLDTHPNIRFAMNTHSFGGYFMWSPAAYTADRTTLPRPDLGVETFFVDASQTILERIEEHRGTVVHPGRTGPVVDVLYSAAGNSGDEHNYDDAQSPDPEVYAWDFEVGSDIWNGEDWESPGLFWPDFETEGFDQAMEFANGFLGMLEVAATWQADDVAPRATVEPRSGIYNDPVTVVFDTSEPATIHYTTDGSRPTTISPTVDAGVLRSTTPVLRLDRTTVVRWIAVDAAGNVSRPRTAGYVIR